MSLRANNGSLKRSRMWSRSCSGMRAPWSRSRRNDGGATTTAAPSPSVGEGAAKVRAPAADRGAGSDTFGAAAPRRGGSEPRAAVPISDGQIIFGQVPIDQGKQPRLLWVPNVAEYHAE